MTSTALLPLIGALLVIAGLVHSAFQGIWVGRFNREKRSFSLRGLGLKANWPALALIVVGAILLLAPSAFASRLIPPSTRPARRRCPRGGGRGPAPSPARPGPAARMPPGMPLRLRQQVEARFEQQRHGRSVARRQQPDVVRVGFRQPHQSGRDGPHPRRCSSASSSPQIAGGNPIVGRRHAGRIRLIPDKSRVRPVKSG